MTILILINLQTTDSTYTTATTTCTNRTALCCAPYAARSRGAGAQLVEALQRAGAAPSARAAVRQLMEGGVRPPVELMAFLNIDAPRRPGSTLYKAMFGASKKHEARLGEATPIQRWCDERGPRPRGPRG